MKYTINENELEKLEWNEIKRKQFLPNRLKCVFLQCENVYIICVSNSKLPYNSYVSDEFTEQRFWTEISTKVKHLNAR